MLLKKQQKNNLWKYYIRGLGIIVFFLLFYFVADDIDKEYENKNICPECEGAGEVNGLYGDIMEGMGVRCNRCKGTGKYKN